MRQDLSLRLEQFKKQYVADETVRSRIAEPPVKFIGDEIMELAVAALLQGENVLLSGGKATGKNILADNLAWLFARPVYTVSFHVNTDSSTLIGTDTFTGGEVRLRRGPVALAAQYGGFCILDEINMAKTTLWPCCTPRSTTAASSTCRAMSVSLSTPPRASSPR